jgi:hypothetical protein
MNDRKDYEIPEILRKEENLAEPPSEAKDDVSDSKSTIVFVVIAGVIIIATILLFYFRNTTTIEEYPTVNYNGFTFQNYGGLWNTTWQNGENLFAIRLHYNPYDVENYTIYGKGWAPSNETYITFDTEGSGLDYVALSAAETSLTLHNAFGLTPIAACSTNETEACHARPIITCKNLPPGAYAIYFQHEGIGEAEINGRCLIIRGEREEMLKATEKVLYKFYGIIK